MSTLYLQFRKTQSSEGRIAMAISAGDRLPEATLLRIGEKGPEQVSLGDLLKDRKLAIFAVPGAYTPTCHSTHVPSFIRVIDRLKAKGLDDVICISVNDPFVMKSWGEATGADAAGISMLADADGSFTKAIGMEFDAAPAGLLARSKRYSMMVEDGTVSIIHAEESSGICEISSGEMLLNEID